jgi:hypothetical protein
MVRFRMAGLVVGMIGLAGVSPAAAEPMCRPALTFKDVAFSAMRPPTMERRWNAIVSIDTSRCKEGSAGFFEIVFARLKENARDIAFRQEFMWVAFDWVPPDMKVEVDFAADETVERYWFDTITSCPCGVR